MAPSRFPEIPIDKVTTRSIHDRQSKVRVEDFAQPHQPGATVADFLKSLPDFLKAADLRAVVAAIVSAVQNKRPVVCMIGAHMIKTGLNPLLIDLVEQGTLSAIAMNGAGAIHDVEIACWGHTSEDVATNLADGSFGMTRETADYIHGTLAQEESTGLGFGEALGRRLDAEDVANVQLSLLAACYRKQIPITVHTAIGTEVVHQHPTADGAKLGEFSLRDFRIFSQVLTEIEGGVVLNFGSAVVLPEVFLKALTVVRNLGHASQHFVTANFDMLQHYRPQVNVVERPTAQGGKGYHITGHHEIMIPLLAAAVKEGLVKST
jgi:deoxyhypusine synthase